MGVSDWVELWVNLRYALDIIAKAKTKIKLWRRMETET